MSDRVYYAIGDVHGEAERLKKLHDFIVEDIARHNAPACVIHLGDLVDRGPDSRGVIETVMAFEHRQTDALQVRTLYGNHEEMMVEAVVKPGYDAIRHWAGNGGYAAMRSYAAAAGKDIETMSVSEMLDVIDMKHIAWLRRLPTIHKDEARKLVFVHAGIDPRTYPNCKEEIHLWTRSPIFFNDERWPKRPELDGLFVVHGHTPNERLEVERQPRRLNIDTGAVFGGALTCAVLAPGEQERFLRA
jgi:serine/threonine protein phosphatase 1